MHTTLKCTYSRTFTHTHTLSFLSRVCPNHTSSSTSAHQVGPDPGANCYEHLSETECSDDTACKWDAAVETCNSADMGTQCYEFLTLAQCKTAPTKCFWESDACIECIPGSAECGTEVTTTQIVGKTTSLVVFLPQQSTQPLCLLAPMFVVLAAHRRQQCAQCCPTAASTLSHFWYLCTSTRNVRAARHGQSLLHL